MISKATPFYRKQLEQRAEDYYRFSRDELLEFVSEIRNDKVNRDDRVINDGKVAVIVSPGHGAGFSTWNPLFAEQLMFDREVIEWIKNGKDMNAILDIQLDLEKKYGEYICILGLENAEIVELPIGTKFFIHEYDGHESVITDFITA